MSSIKDIKDFYDYLSKNKDLQKKLSDKMKKVSNENTAMHIITNFAKKQNYFFSVDELCEFVKKESHELSSESVENQELSKVAGGKQSVHNKKIK